MENQQNDEIEIDLLELLGVIRSKIVSVLVTGVIVAALAGFITAFLIEPKYESTSKLYIAGDSSGIASLTSLQLGSQLTQDYMELIKSRPVMEKVIENLGLDMDYDGLCNIITLNNPSDTRFLEITATTTDPYMAKEITDEVASVAMARIVYIMHVDEPTVAEYGHLEEDPFSPSLVKNIAIGFIAGAFVCAFIVIVMHLMNDTISTEEDVRKYLGLDTLGMIPIEEGTYDQLMRDKRKRKYQGNQLIQKIIRRNDKSL